MRRRSGGDGEVAVQVQRWMLLLHDARYLGGGVRGVCASVLLDWFIWAL